MRKVGVLLAMGLLFTATHAAFSGWNDEEDNRTYRVVINHEEQYSVWFTDRELPRGWEATGFSGKKKECLDHIEEIWTDMRPLSFRKKMGKWSEDEGQAYAVVINHEEQYSIWFADREVPEGWKPAGFKGARKECLDYIEEVWTDMRPLSLRKHWQYSEKKH